MKGIQGGLASPVSKKGREGEKEMSSFIPLTTQNAYNHMGLCKIEGTTIWKALVTRAPSKCCRPERRQLNLTHQWGGRLVADFRPDSNYSKK